MQIAGRQFWGNAFSVGAVLILILSMCNFCEAEKPSLTQTLRVNERVSIYPYKCKLSIRSSSTSRAVVRCSARSRRYRTLPAGYYFLTAKQSARIKAKSCQLEVIGQSASLVKLRCRSASSTPTPTPTIAPSTTISTSVSTLALSVNNAGLNAALSGNPRTITITNVGSDTALSISLGVSPSLPSGTTINSTCSNLAPSSACTVTITPGSNPSAAPADTNPVPVVVTINGSNTNTIASEVQVLTYGSVHQGGYLFAVDDSTPATSSIGGKVASLLDQSGGIAWDPGCPSACTGAISANSDVDGAANSLAIVNAMSSTYAANLYAAGLCSLTISGFSDWYLPAICELSYGDNGGSSCGQINNPTLQNIQSSIVDHSVVSLTDTYWSSTQISGDPLTLATFNFFPSAGFQGGDTKETNYFIRCVRSLTP